MAVRVGMDKQNMWAIPLDKWKSWVQSILGVCSFSCTQEEIESLVPESNNYRYLTLFYGQRFGEIEESAKNNKNKEGAE